MNGAAARPVLPGRGRRLASRLVWYILLQALIAIVWAVILRLPPPC